MDLFKEALEMAAKDRAGAMSPEIARRMQERMMHRVMPGAAVPSAGAESAAGALPQFPAGPQMPPGFVDPLYRSALAQLDQWMARNERYRNQGDFAQLESVFQAIKDALA